MTEEQKRNFMEKYTIAIKIPNLSGDTIKVETVFKNDATPEFVLQLIAEAEEKRDSMWREKIKQAFIKIETTLLPAGGRVLDKDEVVEKLYESLLSPTKKEGTSFIDKEKINEK